MCCGKTCYHLCAFPYDLLRGYTHNTLSPDGSNISELLHRVQELQQGDDPATPLMDDAERQQDKEEWDSSFIFRPRAIKK